MSSRRWLRRRSSLTLRARPLPSSLSCPRLPRKGTQSRGVAPANARAAAQLLSTSLRQVMGQTSQSAVPLPILQWTVSCLRPLSRLKVRSSDMRYCKPPPKTATLRRSKPWRGRLLTRSSPPHSSSLTKLRLQATAQRSSHALSGRFWQPSRPTPASASPETPLHSRSASWNLRPSTGRHGPNWRSATSISARAAAVQRPST
mmetsp:Transcript_23491/g.66801  ORF Transcript_23491/g.66801 Transcript_23491/m.66801 type:complete len:202 (+) Transcript_23491:430-1035(+)